MIKKRINVCAVFICFVMGMCGFSPLFSKDVTPPFLDAKGVIIHSITEGRFLCVINTGYDEGAYWFLLEGMNKNREIGKGLSRLAEVNQLMASPDGKYLAVCSVGEGHPMIEIIDLNTLCTEGKFNTLQFIDPYPGTASIGKWNGSKLVLLSDMPLTRRNPEDGRVPDGETLHAVKTFCLDMTTGKTEEMCRQNSKTKK